MKQNLYLVERDGTEAILKAMLEEKPEEVEK